MGMQEAAEVLLYCFSDALAVPDPAGEAAGNEDLQHAPGAAAGDAASADGWTPLQQSGALPLLASDEGWSALVQPFASSPAGLLLLTRACAGLETGLFAAVKAVCSEEALRGSPWLLVSPSPAGLKCTVSQLDCPEVRGGKLLSLLVCWCSAGCAQPSSQLST